MGSSSWTLAAALALALALAARPATTLVIRPSFVPRQHANWHHGSSGGGVVSAGVLNYASASDSSASDLNNIEKIPESILLVGW